MKGLKTGLYYLRSRAAADAIKFTVDTSMLKVEPASLSSLNKLSYGHFLVFKHITSSNQNMFVENMQEDKPVEDNLESKMAQLACSLENREECMACGS